MREEIPAEAVERGLAGTDETLNPEKRDEGLKAENCIIAGPLGSTWRAPAADRLRI